MIIIETTTRERLVLVPEKQIVCTTHTRDATPEDLARGGFVLREQAAPGTLAHLRADLRDMTARAERAERLREECESVLTAMGARAREAEEFARVLEAERDTLLAELADAKAECQGAMLSAYAQYAETVRERDTARAELARLTAPAEGEPTDEALRDAFEVAYRDAASECHANAIRAIYRLGVAHERASARLTEPTFPQSTGTHTFGGRPRAGQGLPPDAQPAQDRATDEELERAYSAAYARAWESEVSTPDRGERAGLRAVAARVRQERCLVARAVAANVDVRVCEDNDGGFMVGVHATGCDEELARCVPASDVPATLARLLGEVSR